VLTSHGTYTINSLSHVFGSQRYKTGDSSRNNWFLALITLGEIRLSMEHAHHGLLGDPDDVRGLERTGGGHTEGLACEATLTKEAASFQDTDGRFLPSGGDDRELHPAVLNEEHGVPRVPLGEDDLFASKGTRGLSRFDPREERLGVEGHNRLLSHDPLLIEADKGGTLRTASQSRLQHSMLGAAHRNSKGDAARCALTTIAPLLEVSGTEQTTTGRG
jgi:hypothetical protein